MNWSDIAATTFVLLIAGALILAMFYIVRVASGESEGSKTIRDMVETLFGTPAHLRGGDDSASGEGSSGGSRLAGASTQLPFREPCPACGEEVTEENVNCPSCELRLL
ncbi:zinc ribbon domain-containing protein [Paenibacillus agaridevorans]|uniref:zinc ribbon domain-containing protein n=1 Tax=Paenibacillus agaridevorans TaxID=171404 RepID=UPI001BE40236|nr:zinc ribbon domain-containing protein [Paenibacillus agaridevorans]